MREHKEFQVLPPLAKGTLIKEKQYRIMSDVVSQGGFGRIYMVTSVTQNSREKKKYALKEFYPRQVKKTMSGIMSMGNYTKVETEGVIRELKARFYQEAKLLSIIGGHRYGRKKNVPTIYGVPFEEGERTFYLMEYIEGPTLTKEVENWESMPEDTAVVIITKIAKVLNKAHKQGLIHGDISPNNIILRDGTPVLVDFGNAMSYNNDLVLSRIETENLSPSQIFEHALDKVTTHEKNLFDEPEVHIDNIGTPGFCAPRELAGKPACDAFSLAATFYFLLTGEKPRLISSEKDKVEMMEILKQHNISRVSKDTIVRVLSMEDLGDRPIREFLYGISHRVIDTILHAED